MKKLGTQIETTRRLLQAVMGILLIGFGVFLLRIHWVRAYSDPIGWISRAINFYEYDNLPRLWSVIYPLYLYWPLRLLGPHYVFVSNLPWLILLVALLGGISARYKESRGGQKNHGDLLLSLWTLLTTIFIGWGVIGELINPYREAVVFSLLLGAFFVLRGRGGLRIWRAGVSGLLFGLSVAMREPHLLAFPSLLLFVFYSLYSELPRRAWVYVPVLFAGIFIGLLPFLIQNAVSSGYWWLPVYIHGNVAPIIEQYGLHPVWLFPNWLAVLCGLGGLGAGGFFFYYLRTHPAMSDDQRKKVWRWCFGLICLLVVMLAVLLAVCLFSGIIPLMNLDRFYRVGPRTVRYFRGQWGMTGVILFYIGIIGMLVRKEWRLLVITIPSIIFFLFFWSFYSYVKPRYVFSVQLFAFPVIAYGIYAVVSGLSAKIRVRRIKEYAPALCACIGVLALSSKLIWIGVQGSESLKVWQLGALRRELIEVMEYPASFACPNERHTQLLSVVLANRDRSMLEFWHENSFGINWRDLASHADLETGLKSKASDVLGDVDAVNIYTYGPLQLAVKFWLDREPILDFGDLPGRLDLYGNVMDGPLYKLVRWSQSTFTHSLEAYDAEEPLLIALDMHRVWDYENRTFWQASAGSFTQELPQINHMIWLPLPERDSDNVLRIESDAPLPKNPYLKVIRLNEAIHIRMGVDGEYWYRNYVDPNFEKKPHIPVSGAVFLLDEAKIQVPVFADKKHEVFLRVRFSSHHSVSPKDGSHFLQLASDVNEHQIPLSERNVPTYVYLPMGKGSGGLELQEVKLTSSLPGIREQRKRLNSGTAKNYENIAIRDMTLFTLPLELPENYTFRVEPNFTPWVGKGKGWYSMEKSGDGYFAWLKPVASIVVPPAEVPGRYDLAVTMVDYRDPDFPAEPEWMLNEKKIEPSRIEKGDKEHITIFFFTSVHFRTDAENIVEVRTKEWLPERDSGIGNSRSLGLGFTGMQWKRRVDEEPRVNENRRF